MFLSIQKTECGLGLMVKDLVALKKEIIKAIIRLTAKTMLLFIQLPKIKKETFGLVRLIMDFIVSTENNLFI